SLTTEKRSVSPAEWRRWVPLPKNCTIRSPAFRWDASMRRRDGSRLFCKIMREEKNRYGWPCRFFSPRTKGRGRSGKERRMGAVAEIVKKQRAFFETGKTKDLK